LAGTLRASAKLAILLPFSVTQTRGHKEHYLRGRDTDELAALLREGAASVGVTDVPTHPTELAGLQAVLVEARPGDALGVMCHAERAGIADWLGSVGATVDTPETIRAKVLRARQQ
jgi:cyanophycin synthetase